MATWIMGLGNVEALLVVAHQPAPSHHRSEGALDDPSAQQHLEPRLAVGAADDLNDEVEECCLIHELGPIVGAVGEQKETPILERTLTRSLSNDVAGSLR